MKKKLIGLIQIGILNFIKIIPGKHFIGKLIVKKTVIKNEIVDLRKNKKIDGNTIIVCNHTGPKDIVSIYATFEYSFVGIVGKQKSDFKGKLLQYFIETIAVDRNNPENNFNIGKKVKKVLRKNKKLLIMIEGAWNPNSDLLVLNTKWGAAKYAKEADSNIYPIAIEYINGVTYIADGKPFKTTYNNNLTETENLLNNNEIIRSSVASIKKTLVDCANISLEKEKIKEMYNVFYDNYVENNNLEIKINPYNYKNFSVSQEEKLQNKIDYHIEYIKNYEEYPVIDLIEEDASIYRPYETNAQVFSKIDALPIKLKVDEYNKEHIKYLKKIK